MNLWVVFLTGLTVGGLTCLAVQGGLLASIITEREKENLGKKKHKKETLIPTFAFLIAKLGAYIILGFVLGLLGQTLSLSDKFASYMQMAAGFYVLAIALNLLDVHPIFRYAVIQPPKFLTRKVRDTSKSKELFAPALLGAMTIFIPCGTTLAMEALAISSGSPFAGALIMGAFVLGTVPLFIALGYVTIAIGHSFKAQFLKYAAYALIYLGVTSVNASLVSLGSSFTLQNLSDVLPKVTIGNPKPTTLTTAPVVDGVQTAEIGVYGNGYRPNYIRLKANQPARINLVVKGNLGCTSFFRIPELGISKNLVDTGSDIIEFTPKRVGKMTFTCSMGMYTGVIEVI